MEPIDKNQNSSILGRHGFLAPGNPPDKVGRFAIQFSKWNSQEPGGRFDLQIEEFQFWSSGTLRRSTILAGLDLWPDFGFEF
jgi:hypothetical protein